MRYLLKNFIGFSLGPVIAAIIAFITIPIITLFVIPEEFGKASMFTVVQGLMSSLVYLGMDQSYSREYHYIENKKKIFQNAVILPLLFSMVFILFSIIFQRQISVLLFESPDYGKISILFGVMLISIIIERFVLLSIRMAEKPIEYSLYSVLVKIVIFVTTIAMLIFWERTFLSIVYSTIIGQLLGGILLVIAYRKIFEFDLNLFDKKLIKKMLLFGLPIIVAASLYSLLNTLGRFFLRGFSTFHEIGIYTAALKIAGILSLIQNTFTGFWIPLAYRWNKENKKIKYFEYMSNVILLIMTVVFFGVVFFKQYIVLILSPEYREAEYVAALLALTPILYTLSETTTLGIVFSGKSQYNVLISLLSLVPATILNVLLVPKYGTIGASIATAASYVSFYFLRTYFSKRCGFPLKTKKQTPVVLLIFVVSILNSIPLFDLRYVNLLMMLICLILQYETFVTTVNIIKNPTKWDFT